MGRDHGARHNKWSSPKCLAPVAGSQALLNEYQHATMHKRLNALGKHVHEHGGSAKMQPSDNHYASQCQCKTPVTCGGRSGCAS